MDFSDLSYFDYLYLLLLIVFAVFFGIKGATKSISYSLKIILSVSLPFTDLIRLPFNSSIIIPIITEVMDTAIFNPNNAFACGEVVGSFKLLFDTKYDI